MEKWAQVKGRDGAGTPPAQPAFDSAMEAFVRVASAALPGRVVEVWLTDAARARIGRAGPSDPRAAVLLARTGSFADVFEIADMAQDPDFAATGALPPGVVAVAPLLAGSGLVVAWSRAQAALAPAERALLRDVAALLSAHLSALAEEREASEQRDLFGLIAAHTSDTLVRGNLDGVRLYISPSAHDLLGYTPEEMVGGRAADIVHPDDLPDFRKMMGEVRAGRLELARTEHRQRRKDGAYVWLEAFLKLTRDKETGVPDGYVASVRDISQRKAAEEALAFAASHDPLTGLSNRAVGEARLSAALARWAGGESAVAVLMLDLDRFKAVNDTLGHGAGDQVLRAAAARIRAELRADDVIARVGGDEFLVVLERAAGRTAPRGRTPRRGRRALRGRMGQRGRGALRPPPAACPTGSSPPWRRR